MEAGAGSRPRRDQVLDLTRVVAGPTGTRFLAACGAEALRLDCPGSDESAGPFKRVPDDLMLGKRWAFLDLRKPEGKARLLELLSEADVLVHGYRPDGIDGLVSPEERQRARPDLVEVAFRAYGWTGPWRLRRGFDTITEFSTGIASGNQTWALEKPETRLPLVEVGKLVDASCPRECPVEVLDVATGYQIAAAAIRGLTRRLKTGQTQQIEHERLGDGHRSHLRPGAGEEQRRRSLRYYCSAAHAFSPR